MPDTGVPPPQRPGARPTPRPFGRLGGGAIADRLRSLRGRPDTEHEMSFNRLTFVAVTALYFATLPDAGPILWGACITYAVSAAALFSHILIRPARNGPRRAAAITLDITIISIGLWAGGEETAVLYPLYLWLVLGNGFRFGVSWLRAAVALSVLQFTVVVLITPFWQGQPHLSAGLLIGLIVVPLYAGTLVRKLSAATQRAEEASKAKSFFLASVSHELRTPLTAIIGMGSLLRDTRLDGEQRDMVETVDRASRSLLSLIESILNHSRLEAGRTPAREDPVDPLTLLDNARRLLGNQAHGKGLVLATNASARLPGRIVAGAQALTDVMLNLAGNAIKFTERGGVSIALDAEPLGEGRVRLRCEVSDTGIGIAPAAQAHIFDSFVQADEGIFHRFGGTGLGLAICKRLITMAGGEIGVRSSPGAGSTFWFTVEVGIAEGERPEAPPQDVLILAGPEEGERVRSLLRSLGHRAWTAADGAGPDHPTLLVVVPDGMNGDWMAPVAERREASWPHELPVVLCQGEGGGLLPAALRYHASTWLPARAGEASWRETLALLSGQAPPRPRMAEVERPSPIGPLSVLVADDNQVNRRVFNAVLTRAGHRAHLVSNGEEALDALEGREFDVVLMDVNMPVMGGLEAVKIHRFSALGGRRVPIIALTADATAEMWQACLEAGVDAYLTKPIEPDRLIEAVEAAVGKEGAGEGGGAGPGPGTALPGNGLGPVLDDLTVAQLEALGGAELLAELAHDFLEDAEERLISLDIAVSEGDVLAYRDTVHALRSGAANLGARAVFDLCTLIQDLRADDLPRHGRPNLLRVSAEIDRARKALADRL